MYNLYHLFYKDPRYYTPRTMSHEQLNNVFTTNKGTRILFCRHAKTTSNEQLAQAYEDGTDLQQVRSGNAPLSEKGLDQAWKVSQHLRTRIQNRLANKINSGDETPLKIAIVCSNLDRTHSTARYIHNVLNDIPSDKLQIEPTIHRHKYLQEFMPPHKEIDDDIGFNDVDNESYINRIVNGNYTDKEGNHLTVNPRSYLRSVISDLDHPDILIVVGHALSLSLMTLYILGSDLFQFKENPHYLPISMTNTSLTEIQNDETQESEYLKFRVLSGWTCSHVYHRNGTRLAL